MFPALHGDQHGLCDDMCVDMCADMCVDMCVDMCADVLAIVSVLMCSEMTNRRGYSQLGLAPRASSTCKVN